MILGGGGVGAFNKEASTGGMHMQKHEVSYSYYYTYITITFLY